MKQNLKDWVADRLTTDGMIESRINGVHLFKVTSATVTSTIINNTYVASLRFQ